MIGLILVVLTVVLFLILGIPVLLWQRALSGKNPAQADAESRRVIQWIFRVLMKLSGIRLFAEGTENIPDEAVLFVGNHRSYFDIVTSYTLMQRKTGYIAKKEMERIPLLRQWMERIGCLFLDRENVREGLKTILAAISEIRAGTSLVIYPEGTRNRNGDETELLEFKEGSLKIAEKARCLVVPMAILGSSAVFEDHIPWIHGAKVVIRFGKPVDLSSLPEEYRKRPALYLQEEIRGMLSEMRKDHPDAGKRN